MSIEQGAERQLSPEDIGWSRLELIGMVDYGENQVVDVSGGVKTDEDGQPVTLARFFGTYEEHGVPNLLDIIANPDTPEAQRTELVSALQAAARFYTGER